MTVHGIKCKKCGAQIYSRARHDFRWCPCEAVAIDGGVDYTKVTGNPEDFEMVTLKLFDDWSDEVVLRNLFEDWNRGENRFGIIKPEDQ